MELAAMRDRSSEIAKTSGGYSEYLLRCGCSDVRPNMDKATFDVFKKLNSRPDSAPFASFRKLAFDEWRELLGESDGFPSVP